MKLFSLILKKLTCKTKKIKSKVNFLFLYSYYEKLNSIKIIEGKISIKEFELFISFTKNFL